MRKNSKFNYLEVNGIVYLELERDYVEREKNLFFKNNNLSRIKGDIQSDLDITLTLEDEESFVLNDFKVVDIIQGLETNKTITLGFVIESEKIELDLNIISKEITESSCFNIDYYKNVNAIIESSYNIVSTEIRAMKHYKKIKTA